MGGLGNQMFQFAMCRSLTISQGRRILVDLSAYRNNYQHQGFELKKIFHCHVGVASQKRLNSVLGFAKYEFVQRMLTLKAFRFFLPKNLVIEPHFQYWPNLFSIQDFSFVKGYWQSEKYFKSIRDVLLDDFAFRIPLDSKNASLASLMVSCNSVAVHVRRGDYLNNPLANATHGLCSKEYYEKAISYMNSAIDNPKFFFFSDDIQWVKAQFGSLAECNFIDWNTGNDSYKDMQLMSLCKHNIVANSSFSWWSAWLNQNSEKKVIAPIRWFVSNIDDSDLIPSTWVRM
jgi:hypothetical protein